MKQLLILGLVLGGCIQEEVLPRSPLMPPQLMEIYTTGLPSIEHGKVANTVARKYGFRYRAIAGCVITNEVAEKKYRNNKLVYSILKIKWGDSWRERFNIEVDSAIKVHHKIDSLLENEKYVSEANKRFYNYGYSFSYHITPTLNHTVFLVSVYAPPINLTDSTCTIYYKTKVDIQQQKVEMLSSQKERIHYSFYFEDF